MHKPEEPLPLPFHVRIFVIIPFSAALRHPTPVTRREKRRRLPEKKLRNVLASNQRICCYRTFVQAASRVNSSRKKICFLYLMRSSFPSLYCDSYLRSVRIAEGFLSRFVTARGGGGDEDICMFLSSFSSNTARELGKVHLKTLDTSLRDRKVLVTPCKYQLEICFTQTSDNIKHADLSSCNAPSND
jgi:hypothetical protein